MATAASGKASSGEEAPQGMPRKWKWAIGLGATALVFWIVGSSLLSFVTGTYDSLVKGNQAYGRTMGVVQIEYQRRSDLVPNIVATTAAEANFERGTLTDVITARSKIAQLNINATDLANDPEKFKQFAEAQQGLSNSLARLMVVIERYPTLKSNAAFKDVRVVLEGTENRIRTAREDTQLVAERQNNLVQGFWTSFVARHYGFKEKPFFTADEGAKNAPAVDFGKKS